MPHFQSCPHPEHPMQCVRLPSSWALTRVTACRLPPTLSVSSFPPILQLQFLCFALSNAASKKAVVAITLLPEFKIHKVGTMTLPVLFIYLVRFFLLWVLHGVRNPYVAMNISLTKHCVACLKMTPDNPPPRLHTWMMKPR